MLSVYRHARISLGAAFTQCHRASCVGGGDERSMTMYELVVYQAVQAEQQRQLAWVNEHAWKYEEVRQQRVRKRNAAVARVLRALAARLAPVEAEAAGEQHPLTAGS
jgi:hypothetical protein